MNMIVNKSDLVGHEAVDRTEAKKKALAKLVSAWESKQAKNAKRFGGLGFLAVSLAACNSSSDDTAATPAASTPVVATPTVTALTQALGATADVITATFTSADDNITAINTGTAATTTLGAGDVLVDSTSTDNDTLTVTLSGAAGNSVAAPSTITGIENIVYNYDGIVTATDSVVAVDNIIGANITINHTGNSAVAPDGSAVTGIGANNTVTFGTSITGPANATVVASATGVTINAGAGGSGAAGAGTDFQVDTGASVDGLTINGGTSLDMDINLGATNKNVTITGGSGAGAEAVAVNSATGVSVTSGAAVTTLTVTGIATSTAVTYSKVGTATAKGSISVDGVGATDAVTVTAAGVHTLETAASDQIETVDLSGNGAAATYELDGTGDAITTLTFSGTQNVTVSMTAAQAAAITTITDNTTAGVTTVSVAAPGGDRDFKAVKADMITVTAAPAVGNVLTFTDGQAVTMSAASGANFGIDVDDGATAASTTGSLTMTLGADHAHTLTVDTTAGDQIATLNIVNDTVAQTGLIIAKEGSVNGTADETVTVNLSGSKNVVMGAATEASHLNAASLTGNLTATVDADNLKITGGSGDDTVTAIATVSGVLDGGAGNDTLITPVGDISASTFTGFEVMDVKAGDVTMKASQISGSSMIVTNTGGAATDEIVIGAGATVDLSTIDLTTLQFSGNAQTKVDATTFNTATFLTGQAFTIKGSSQIDTLTGSANADTIEGNAGADILAGGAGADIISGGAGDDNITGGAGADVIDGGAGVDTISVTLHATAAETITGGAGNDIIKTTTGTAATAAVVKITDFDAGTSSTSADVLQLSKTALIGLDTTTRVVDTNASTANGTTVVTMTSDGMTATNADLVVLGNTYASDTAALAGIKTAGSDTITYGAGLTNNDSFLIAYTDGSNTYVAVATAGAASLTTSEGVDSLATVVEFTGMSSTAALNTADFATIA